MEFKFECNDNVNGTLEFKGNAENLFETMGVLGNSIRNLLNEAQLPVSATLLPFIASVSETEGKTSPELTKALLVEMQNDLSEFCEQMEEDAPSKKEPKYYNGKVVCVNAPTNSTNFTVGKIYSVVNGRLEMNGVNKYLIGFASLEHINNVLEQQFIEVVE